MHWQQLGIWNPILVVLEALYLVGIVFYLCRNIQLYSSVISFFFWELKLNNYGKKFKCRPFPCCSWEVWLVSTGNVYSTLNSSITLLLLRISRLKRVKILKTKPPRETHLYRLLPLLSCIKNSTYSAVAYFRNILCYVCMYVCTYGW